MPNDPNTALENMRRQLREGARLLLGNLSDEELIAAHVLILEGEAQINHEAGKPLLVRVLPH